MEYRTEFNLGKEINQWAISLSDSNALSEENIQELKIHILDQMDNLTEKGLSQEEAYWVAQKRLGNMDELIIEYKKVDKTSNKQLLKTICGGALLMFTVVSFIGFLSTILSFMKHLYTLDNSGITFMVLLSMLVGIFSLIITSIKKQKVSSENITSSPFKLLFPLFLFESAERLIMFYFTGLVNPESFGQIIVSANLLKFFLLLLIIVGMVFYINKRNREAKEVGYIQEYV